MRPVRFKAAAIVAAAAGLWGVQAARAAEYATVISSTPVTATVSVPRQVCSDSQEVVQQRPSGAGAVIGAIAGGVLGHTVGGGFGQAAATGLGVVAGAAVGNQVEANSTPPMELPVRRCQTVSSREGRIVGYDVMYEYGGQRYSTRMTSDPGKQLAVTVQPADAGGASVPVPAASEQAAQAAPPQTVIYQQVPAPVYYNPYPAPYYMGPVIGLGFGYYGGYGGYRGHWH